jgi:hypothetical protein
MTIELGCSCFLVKLKSGRHQATSRNQNHTVENLSAFSSESRMSSPRDFHPIPPVSTVESKLPTLFTASSHCHCSSF